MANPQPQLVRKHQREKAEESSGAESALKKPKRHQNFSPCLTKKNTALALLDMPDEILEMIIGKLPFQDIVKARRVCKRLHKMFPIFCTAPVVQYPYLYTPHAKVRGLARLQKILRTVTHPTTHTLTIQQPRDCKFVINAAIAEDLKKRCPLLKRLILQRLIRRPRVKDGAIRALPSSLQLELHNAWIQDNKSTYRTTFLHGIFRGPFDNWTVSYIDSKRRDPGFGAPLNGTYQCGYGAYDDSDNQEDNEHPHGDYEYGYGDF